MTNHRTQLKSGRKSNLYEKMREIGEEKFYIELIEEYPCQNSEQLVQREGEWMRQIANLNEHVAGRNNKQYKQENKESIKEREKHITKKTKNKYYKDKKNSIKKTKKGLMNDIRNTMKNTKKKYKHIVMQEKKRRQNTIKHTIKRIRNNPTKNIKNGLQRTKLKCFVKSVIVNTLNMTKHTIYKENIIWML